MDQKVTRNPNYHHHEFRGIPDMNLAVSKKAVVMFCCFLVPTHKLQFRLMQDGRARVQQLIKTIGSMQSISFCYLQTDDAIHSYVIEWNAQRNKEPEIHFAAFEYREL